MREIREWIQREGKVISPSFLKVDGFLNHRIDPEFIEMAGDKLAEAFADQKVTCVLTAEAGGNIIAYEVALSLDAFALYAKKGQASTMENPVGREVTSATKERPENIFVCRDYLDLEQRVLVVDDFLHQGSTAAALAEMVRQCGANLVGFGFVIEKCFSQGRERLKRFDVPIIALARITGMDSESGVISFLSPSGG